MYHFPRDYLKRNTAAGEAPKFGFRKQWLLFENKKIHGKGCGFFLLRWKQSFSISLATDTLVIQWQKNKMSSLFAQAKASHFLYMSIRRICRHVKAGWIAQINKRHLSSDCWISLQDCCYCLVNHNGKKTRKTPPMI